MRRIFYLAWSMLLTTALHAQINCNTETFLRTFGATSSTEVGLTLCPSGDGNLYASGVEDNQTVLLKLSPSGDVLWSRAFHLNSELPCVINEMFVDGNGMLVAAGIETDTQPNATSLAFRYDPVANSMLWIKRFEGDSVFANGIIEKSPGGNYIFYQNTISIGTLSARAQVLELNRTTGDVVPSLARHFSLNNAAEFTRMVSYEGSLYAIGTAQTLSIPIPSFRPLLTRFDSSNAQPTWSTLTYVTTSPTDLIGMDLLIDNDTILSLSGGAFLGVGTPGPIHLYLQKNTLNGTLLWLKTYEVPQFTNEFGAEIVKLDDGYAIYGTGQAADSSFSQLLLKLDHDGNVLIAKTLGNTDQSALLPFLKGEAIAFDNHLFFAGTVGATNTDWSILKTDSLLTLTDSCGYLQTLNSVTSAISPNPQSISTTLLSVQDAVVNTTDTTATFSDITLVSQLLCPVCADTCSQHLDLGPDVVFCQDTTVTIDAGAGFVSYLWNDSTTTSTFTFTLDSQNVTITVTVVDTCGFTQRDTLHYIFLDSIAPIPDQVLCQGDSVTLNFPGFANYQFLSDTTLAFDSLGTIVLSPDSTTTYTLFVSTIDGCAKTDTFQITVTTPVITSDTLTACAGDFILIDSVSYTQDTVITVTLPNANGCDTIVTRQLIFTPLPTQTDSTVTCLGDSIVIGGITYTQDTILVDTLASSTGGCDTLVTRQLIFTPGATESDTLTACTGSAIIIGGVSYTQDTTLTENIPSTTGGCDTIRTRLLVFNPQPIFADTIVLCAGGFILFEGVTYTQDTTIIQDTLPASGSGCDTLLATTLIFEPLGTTADTLQFCQGDSITFGGVVYTQSGTVVDTIFNVSIPNGCDSIITHTLIFSPRPIFADTIVLCAGGFILFEGVTYTQDTTIIQDTLPASGSGCDTLLVTTLIFEPLGTTADTLQFCQGDSITFGGVVYTQSGTVVDTIFNVSIPNGCDSLITHTLIFSPRPTVSNTLQACPGDSITIAGVTYFQDTIVVDTLASTSGGCDTISTYTLVFAQPTLTDTIQFAPGDTVFVNGTPYTFPVIVTDTIPSTTGGCDTIATYVLQYLTPFTITCQPDITVTAPFGDTTTVVDYDLPTVTTSCPGGFSTFTLLSGLPVGGSFPIGVTTVCIQATDSCGNTDTCCFNVTVLGGQQACDVKTNGCFRWELYPIKLDSVGQRRYQIKVVNNCTKKVDYVLFQVPNGITAVAPANNSIFSDATSGRKYIVRNPNYSPFYSVRFKADTSTNLSNGVFDVLEYKLPQQSQPTYIHTLVKFEDGTTLEAHLNTFNCPTLPYPNFGPNPVDNRNSLTGQDLGLYPNPTDGALFFDLAEWENQQVQIEVINAQGRLVQTMKVTAEPGLQTLQLDGHLPNGLYHLVVRPYEGIPVAEPFILQRD